MQISPMRRPLIVGAGPAGCSAALALLRGGLDPVLVDTRPERLEAFAAAGGLDRVHRPSLVTAEAFHAERGRVWLRSAHGVETRPFSHLVLATGLHPVELPDPSGDWHPAGALPDSRLAALLGCTFAYDEHACWIVPWTDPATRATSIGGVFVIGGARGVVDGTAAEVDGRRCAAGILGFAPDGVRPAGEGVRKAWSGGMPAEIPDEAVICPCSNTSLAEVRQAIAAGADDTHHVGRLSGAGEGACRGRRCGLAVASVLASCTDRTLPEILSAPTEFPAISVPVSEFIEVIRERPATFPLSQDEGHLS
jgi:bacterioferritin-associated ferredoxin